MTTQELVKALKERKDALLITYGCIGERMGGAAENNAIFVCRILQEKFSMSLSMLIQIAGALEMDVCVSNGQKEMPLKVNQYWPIWRMADAIMDKEKGEKWKIGDVARKTNVNTETIRKWYECDSEPRLKILQKYLDGLGLEILLREREAAISA